MSLTEKITTTRWHVISMAAHRAAFTAEAHAEDRFLWSLLGETLSAVEIEQFANEDLDAEGRGDAKDRLNSWRRMFQ